MLKDLIKLANHLDAKGLRKEADYLDGVIQKLAGEAGKDDGIINRLMDRIKNLGPELAEKLLHMLESEDEFLGRLSKGRAKRIEDAINEAKKEGDLETARIMLIRSEGLGSEADIQPDRQKELWEQYSEKYKEITGRPAPSESSEQEF